MRTSHYHLVVMDLAAAVQNGVLVPHGGAVLPLWDAGITLGNGLFETMRWDGGHVAFMPRHWQRMATCAAQMHIAMPTLSQWQAATVHCVQHALMGQVQDGWRVKWILSSSGNWLVLCFPPKAIPSSMNLVTIDFPLADRRQALMKTLSYADNLRAKQMALDAGADECIRLDHQGKVAEGAMVNLFAVIGNRVVTADANGILPGVTRSVVLELCASPGWPVPAIETRVSRDDFLSASEWFASNALIGICPVISIDGIVRAAGPVTIRLLDAYRRFIGK
jgi:branched-subunit amino acid aminotransferase/4-amino-4-deoxychorismate lyase